MTSEVESAFRGEVPEGWHVVNPLYMTELKAALAERDRLAADKAELVAVIAEAYTALKSMTQGTHAPYSAIAKAFGILEGADGYEAMLAERDAEKWDEGRTFAAQRATLIPASVIQAPNPYRTRKETGR